MPASHLGAKQHLTDRLISRSLVRKGSLKWTIRENCIENEACRGHTQFDIVYVLLAPRSSECHSLPLRVDINRRIYCVPTQLTTPNSHVQLIRVQILHILSQIPVQQLLYDTFEDHVEPSEQNYQLNSQST